MRRHLVLLLVVGSCSLLLPSVGTAVTSSASLTRGASKVGLSIVHVLRGCHVWSLGAKRLGPTPTISVKPGTRVTIRVSCPMDFDVVQTRGPRLALGNTRFISGTTRTVVFRKAGVYRLVARNVQSSQEVGLQTLGDDNTLKLTVRVR